MKKKRKNGYKRNLAKNSHEKVEEFLLKKYGAKGYSKEQILNMKLKTDWPFIKHIKSKKERQ